MVDFPFLRDGFKVCGRDIRVSPAHDWEPSFEVLGARAPTMTHRNDIRCTCSLATLNFKEKVIDNVAYVDSD